MLSVAQAVHHPETPGSASKHSALGHSWSSERPNMLKRRKTEPDCYMIDKKITKSSIENLKSFNFNNQEITLTVIPKNNNQNDFKELLHGKIKTSPIIEKEELIISDKTQEEKRNSDRIPTNISPVFIHFLENSEEIQLTKLGSNENIKLVNQNEIIDNGLIIEESTKHSPECTEKLANTSNQKNNFLESNSIEFSEVTIEPCSNFNKSKIIKSPISSIPNNSKIKKIVKTQIKLEKACELLKKKELLINRSPHNSTINETFDNNLQVISTEINKTFNCGSKTNFAEVDTKESFELPNCIKQNSLFDEESQQQLNISSASDYIPFNIGIPCNRFYTNSKDKPYYTTGFPNPPGENRCWTNATLQALFILPVMNKLDTLNVSECSKLMTSLINIQTFWHKGNTGSHNFEQIFSTFKEELSVLDKLYSSKAQQDVSEFVMNLLNFIKAEFETMLIKEIHNSEIENIPNNEHETLRRSQSNTYELNKRLPLADISASAGQLRNNNLATYSGHQDILNSKTNSLSMKTKYDNQIEVNSNPMDEYFSLFMMENYICDNCSKQRQQNVENLILFIDLPSEDHGTTVNLIDIINTTYALEHRHMTCESCKHDVHSMVTKFKKLPKILIVQVKRYEMTKDGIITKKSTLVEIPTLLKLNSLVINNNQDFNHFPEYEPICIISHIGDNIDSGHYISFVKHEDHWFYYDDMNVKLLSAEEVFKCIRSNAYVIFFQDTRLSQNTDVTVDQKNKKESITC